MGKREILCFLFYNIRGKMKSPFFFFLLWNRKEIGADCRLDGKEIRLSPMMRAARRCLFDKMEPFIVIV